MQTIFILGAGGRLGRNATAAFKARGWRVIRLVRPGGVEGQDTVLGDPLDARSLAKAARAVRPDVILNALNPAYPDWARDLPRLTEAAIAAARATGALTLLPGNVYNFGENMPGLLTPDTPQLANTRKGRMRIEMENAWRSAEVPVAILRAGDFIDTLDSGNWFETYMTKSVSRGKLVYPGPVDRPHAWAFLPDLARAMVDLAEMRPALPSFLDLPFPGFTVTGAELALAISDVTGREVHTAGFPWPMIRAMGLVSPMMRELTEMRYLWSVPHRLDGSAFGGLLPDFEATSLPSALVQSLAGAGRISTQTRRWSEKAAASASG